MEDSVRSGHEARRVPRRVSVQGGAVPHRRRGLRARPSAGGRRDTGAALPADRASAHEGRAPYRAGSRRLPVDGPPGRPPGPALGLAADDRTAATLLTGDPATRLGIIRRSGGKTTTRPKDG